MRTYSLAQYHYSNTNAHLPLGPLPRRRISYHTLSRCPAYYLPSIPCHTLPVGSHCHGRYRWQCDGPLRGWLTGLMDPPEGGSNSSSSFIDHGPTYKIYTKSGYMIQTHQYTIRIDYMTSQILKIKSKERHNIIEKFEVPSVSGIVRDSWIVHGPTVIVAQVLH